MALDKNKKDEIIKNDLLELSHQSPKTSLKKESNSMNYDFVQNQGDLYISFPDIMVWISKRDSLDSIDFFRRIYDSIETVDNDERKSLDSFIEVVVKFISKAPSKYVHNLKTIQILKILLNNSLEVLGMKIDNNEIAKQHISKEIATKMRYKAIISNIRLVHLRDSHSKSLRNAENCEFYSIEIFLQRNKILDTDHVKYEQSGSIVEWETIFEIYFNLIWEFLEFWIYKTDASVLYKLKLNDDDYLNMPIHENGDHTRNSNPFEPSSKSKSNTDSGSQ